MRTGTDEGWLGIDLGTQSVRALLVAGTGEILGAGSAALTSRRIGPRHEQEPEEWWRAVGLACRAAVAQAPRGLHIRGLAVDATSGTVLLMDEAGRALTPALMYDDARAATEAAQVNQAGAAEWAALGYHRMQPSWGLPKLLWLLRNDPHVPTGARLAHQSDFINRRLVGEVLPTDSSNALKSGIDLRTERWPEDVLERLQIGVDLMPKVVRSGTRLGAVSASAAAETGLPAGTPVWAGMTDGCAAQIGAGALAVGSWNAVLGTTLVLKGVTQELLQDPAGVVYSHRAPDGTWLPGGASSTGAGAVAQRFAGRDLDALAAAAAQYEPAEAVAYPLGGQGERFPFVAAEASGFTLGAPRHEAEEYAALLQGVAFIERLCFDCLDLLGAPTGGPLLLTGGGARSRYWCQLRADVLGRPVTLPESAEPALGMAVLAAAEGSGLAETARRMVRWRETLDPRDGHHARFQQPYLLLVSALNERGWLPPELSRHAALRARL